MKAYEGYRSWNAWNVCLWLDNDEKLYTMGKEVVDMVKENYIRNPITGEIFDDNKKIKMATSMIYDRIHGLDFRCITRTPDGGKFNRLSIRTWVAEQFEEEVAYED